MQRVRSGDRRSLQTQEEPAWPQRRPQPPGRLHLDSRSALANAKKLSLRRHKATGKGSQSPPAKHSSDPGVLVQGHAFGSAATYGDLGEAKPLGAMAPRLCHYNGECGRLRTWSAGGESWAWAPQTVPSGASPGSVGTRRAKPQFSLNARQPGWEMQK